MNGWSDLPAEIIELIIQGVDFPNDVGRIRLVCRSWRSSVPRPSRALSPIFPHRISLSSPPFTEIKNHHRPIDLFQKAVYLLRPHSDPSKVWMVSMEEANAGKLRLRHPVTDEPISLSPSPDLSAWSLTEISTSHRFCFADGTAQALRFDDWWTRPLHPTIQGPNQRLASSGKVILVSNPPLFKRCSRSRNRNSNSNSNSICNFSFVVLFNRNNCVSASRLSDKNQVLEHVAMKKCDKLDFNNIIQDIVYFDGLVFAVNSKGRIYTINPQTWQATIADDSRFKMPWQIYLERKRLVVSNGDLFMFSKFPDDYYLQEIPATTCVVYKLIKYDDHDLKRRLYKWDKVEDLGDQVFFFSIDCSYSVSAQHLPYPWRGNCVVFDTEACVPYGHQVKFPIQKQEMEVFHLGGEIRPISFHPGYSNLFNPSPTDSVAPT